MRPFREIVSEFRRLAFEIDCIDMQLVQKVAENPIRFVGRGYIRQTSNDTLSCKIFVERVENVTQVYWLDRMLSGKPGQLYAFDDYFDLTSKDARNIVWRAEKILPSVSWYGENAIVMMNLDKLTVEGSSEEVEHSICLHFFEDAELPLMIDSFEFAEGNYQFSIHKLEGSFTVEVMSANALLDDFSGRVQEALRFLLSKSVSWRVMYASHGKRRIFQLAAAVPRSLDTRFPPIERRKVFAYVKECWHMFFLYLEYVLTNSKPGYWSHCSYHLHNARESSANSLDAWCYGLSIAVEGLSALLPGKESDEEQALLEDMIEDVLNHVSKNASYSSLLDRFKGRLNSMSDAPPPDRMHLLVSTAHLDQKHIAAWKHLRNRFVHPKEIELEKLDNKKLQKLMNEINSVTVLMYQIVFFIIKYSGRYTDYATLGFPEKNYSFNIEPSSPLQ